MLKIFKIIIIAFCLNSVAYAHDKNFDRKNISILVSSCDKYSQLWKPFFFSLYSNWPELNSDLKDIDVYLIANNKTYSDPRVKMINIANELSWSDNMIEALDKIDSEYVLMFLDDYWINAPVNQKRLLELLKLMPEKDIGYMQLAATEGNINNNKKLNNSVSGLAVKDKFQNYRVSLQLILWHKETFKLLLRSGESAWDFEVAGSIRSSGNSKKFIGVIADQPISYINASYQGHITPIAVEVAQKLDPNFESNMPVLKKRNWRLIWRGIKHRYVTSLNVVKRAIFKTEQNATRYKFDEIY